MEEWLHCNVCIKRWGAKDLAKPLHFTTCKHVFCSACKNRKDLEVKVCPYCKKKCNVAVLDGKIPASIEQLFKAPESLLRQVMEISQFHRSQRAHLIHALMRKSEQQEKIIKMAKEELLKNSREVKKIHFQNEEMKKYINALPQRRFNTPGPKNVYMQQSPVRSPLVQQQNKRRIDERKLISQSVPVTPRNNQFKTPDMRMCNITIETPKSFTVNGRLRLNSPPVNGKLSTPTSSVGDHDKSLNASFNQSKNRNSPHIVISPLVRNSQHRHRYQSNIPEVVSSASVNMKSPYIRSDIYKKPIFPK